MFKLILKDSQKCNNFALTGQPGRSVSGAVQPFKSLMRLKLRFVDVNHHIVVLVGAAVVEGAEDAGDAKVGRLPACGALHLHSGRRAPPAVCLNTNPLPSSANPPGSFAAQLSVPRFYYSRPGWGPCLRVFWQHHLSPSRTGPAPSLAASCRHQPIPDSSHWRQILSHWSFFSIKNASKENIQNNFFNAAVLFMHKHFKQFWYSSEHIFKNKKFFLSPPTFCI